VDGRQRAAADADAVAPHAQPNAFASRENAVVCVEACCGWCRATSWRA
jgi:hypothetical protein